MADSADGRVRRIWLLDVGLDPVTLDDAVSRIDDACRSDTPLQIVTVNMHFLTLAGRSPAFAGALAGAGLAVADGRPMLWAARLAGTPLPQQVTGHDLARACIELCGRRGYRMALVGGGEGVAAELAGRLRNRHPGLSVEAFGGGAFDDTGRSADQPTLTRQLRDFSPHVILVALGAPKQDLWIASHLREVGGRVGIGVGGVFDTLTGRLPRAPWWMQLAGLESLFQLAIEPGRYARRYVMEDPPTAARLFASVLRRRLKGAARSRRP